MTKSSNRYEDDYFVCSNCGAELPLDANFCHQCGASDESGWNDDEDLSSSGDSSEWEDDPTFDYDEFIAREFPSDAASARPRFTLQTLLLTLLALLCIALTLLLAMQ